jgi:CoA:oxalate CoA-transferase
MTSSTAPAAPAGQLLAGASARVTGTGATARILRRHLALLGAEVQAGAGVLSAAAEARVRLPGGTRREIIVDWAGQVGEPGITDEATAQAVCGVMHVNGRRAGEPRGLAVDYCGTAAGVLAMTGFLASLHVVSAQPVRIETSVAETALLVISQYLAGAGADDPEAVDLSPGGPPFVSADGVRFEVEVLQPEPWAAFWTALGADQPAVRAGWRPFQFRYATATAPLPPELHRAAGDLAFATIADIGVRSGVDVCRLYGTAELEPVEPPWTLTPIGGGAPARRGTSLDAPLRPLGVLEAGRRVQAPLATHLLRLLGADVTRIEPPGGDPLRGMPPCSGDLSARWLALNRGKDAMEIDIKSPADRRGLRELAAGKDVFLHNWAPGKAEELDLTAADMPAGLLYAYTSAWGGSQAPDLPPGTDFMVQARTGLADLVGPPGQAPAPSLMTVLDVLGGLLGAEAVIAGLLARQRLGTGIAVRSSLLGAAQTLSDPPPSGDAEEQRGPGFRQPRRTSAGWLARPDRTTGPEMAVTTDLAALLDDTRMAKVIGRDEHGCPALCPPWRFS